MGWSTRVSGGLSGAQVVAQYFTFLRLGFDGYQRVQSACREVATSLARHVEELGPFRLLTDGTQLPVFAFTLDERVTHYSVFDVSAALRESGWLVPAYTFPANRTLTPSVGGSDADFVSALTACHLGNDATCSAAVAKAEAFVQNVLPARLGALYAQICARAANAMIVVVGYPRLFEPGRVPAISASRSAPASTAGRTPWRRCWPIGSPQLGSRSSMRGRRLPATASAARIPGSTT